MTPGADRTRIDLTNVDRWFLTWFFRFWPEVAKRSLLASPGTLLRWQRQGFRSYWRWKSRAKPGRPRIDDKKYGDAFKRTVRAFGIRDRPISPHSPWQDGSSSA